VCVCVCKSALSCFHGLISKQIVYETGKIKRAHTHTHTHTDK
jgi:hypothetical protein